jgi:PAS domain S-box-containing protein
LRNIMEIDPGSGSESIVDVFQKSDKRLQAIYESTKSIRFILVEDYTVIFFNKKAREEFFSVFGIELIVGMNMSNYLTSENVLGNLATRVQKSLKGEYIVSEDLIKAGESKEWYNIEFHPLILDNKATAVSISIRNINDKKKKDIKLQEQNTLLRDIVFSLSHDVRAPLANILGLVSLLDRSELSGENKEVAEFLELATMKLDKIITKVVRDISNVNVGD